MTAIPKIKIVNQLISDESGVYRVQRGDRVGYITISTDVFDEDTMCRPYLLIPQLPELPATAWTRMTISPSQSSKYDVTVSNNPLPGIETLWHPRKAILEVHEAGLVHGDVNRYNFLVNREQDRAILIDLEHAEEFDEVSAQRELDSLAAELSETSGRGGPPIPV
ncbi:hypothetical protein KC315_g6452 [Hortaea werneckii]|nr:hypothetical protein KC315_g6452 [Hortaea werneckii]